MKRDDDVTDPEGLEPKLIEVEREQNGSNGRSYPTDPVALASIVERVQGVQGTQGNELTRLQDEIAGMRTEMRAGFANVAATIVRLSKLISIRNAAPWAQTLLAGFVGGAVVATFAWLAK